MANILLREKDIPGIGQYDTYVQHGGYDGLKKALGMKPDEVIQVVKDSNLRGRGGAGFPTGMKWSFVPKTEGPKYITVNADESEPGTFKDRQILEYNFQQLLEGSLICAYAVQASAVYIYARGEFWDIGPHMEAEIEKARKAGWVGQNIGGSGWGCEVYVHLGAGAYICGEESALLNSIEGKLGQPRVRPPFPAVAGLYARPTVINNVETLANVPQIIVQGAAWFKSIGTEKSPGPKIFCMSGHIEKPGNYEFPLGLTFRQLIEAAGGVRGGKKLKAILPSGASGPLLPATDKVLDTALTYEDVAALGSVLGSASVIILDESTDMVWATLKMARFFKHESCGKCTPCREGTYWLLKRLEAIYAKKATPADVQLIEDVAKQMQGKSLCALGDFATSPVMSALKYWRDEFLAYTQPQKPAPAKAGKDKVVAGGD
ncbi:MAG: NADH-quinone oxidoreductase subunit NuoF [Anaerolinea sp.]|nr:NADH-quinone oxidoreductase subunit NuoF [Anaerolinea sp.]MCC6975210.1 NADH-quinone oxidoreductase subunit NuoF [Anaerolineae bacterium]